MKNGLKGAKSPWAKVSLPNLAKVRVQAGQLKRARCGTLDATLRKRPCQKRLTPEKLEREITSSLVASSCFEHCHVSLQEFNKHTFARDSKLLADSKLEYERRMATKETGDSDAESPIETSHARPTRSSEHNTIASHREHERLRPKSIRLEVRAKIPFLCALVGLSLDAIPRRLNRM